MSILFLDGTVIDGDGRLTERAAVLVEGDRIAAAGPSATLEARRRDPDVSTVDLGGRTVMPGLIDTHIHLAGGDFAPDEQGASIGLAALRTAQVATRTLMAGVTTVRVAGSRDYLDVDLRDAIREGTVTGPRVLASGRRRKDTAWSRPSPPRASRSVTSRPIRTAGWTPARWKASTRT